MLQARPSSPPPDPEVWAPASSASLTSDSPRETDPAKARIGVTVGTAFAGRDSFRGGGFGGAGLAFTAVLGGAGSGFGTGGGGSGGSGVTNCTMIGGSSTGAGGVGESPTSSATTRAWPATLPAAIRPRRRPAFTRLRPDP